MKSNSASSFPWALFIWSVAFGASLTKYIQNSILMSKMEDEIMIEELAFADFMTIEAKLPSLTSRQLKLLLEELSGEDRERYEVAAIVRDFINKNKK